MKQILLLLIMIFAVPFKGQVYPLNNKNKSDAPNGSYFKDLDGELDKYIGLWKGNWNGKTVYLDLRKYKYKLGDDSNYIYQDKILGERKIIAADGTVEIDRISNFDNTNSEFIGMEMSLKNGNWKRIYFYPKNMCNKIATLDITNFTNNQMTLHFEYEPSFVDPNCQYNAYVDQYGDFPVNFPKDIVLTKQ
ncbi:MULTISPECIES: DUF6705 family protein [Chryseobacterium]|uniref:DUF6705 domain-containing protein n=1 Tax=Chryseobacterium camelliae TaxID=1265445 RepID=A0ABU0TMV3_9FLAO|nr:MULTISPECIES: DUF6705 family protein [Chryseobacterium]MDT3407764.1 hypothetical protein [Pseudacidovorax intermedius]MDQ1098385.1 hypothetical protein [Chryseobacterium camelliae]MDQ1102308.1 hypothetical protein [Chryseobacterium sp. SORGH_AS_1048]MDR6085745.1 hypothetical protein [Chryseobacterium sp. SORGH_AS_0909]MDR6130110.1 hypothetical protein [Chryseobacterium sp. SORGH_AS_1175]